MIDYQNNFLKEYQKLNPAQRQAVDAIEGPVMVIAGAGTGKTQTIALRIANILAKTDTPPSSILCLTFTDNASFNMRKRLLEIIGPTAYSVQIHTFHSFCHLVINTHPDLFPQTSLSAIEEVDKIEIITDIIEALPHTSPLKPSGEPLFYLSSVSSAIQHLKREGFSPKKLQKLLLSQQNFINHTSKYYQAIKSLRSGKSLASELLFHFSALVKSKYTPLRIKKLLTQKYQYYQKGVYDIGKAKNPAINFKNDLLSVFDNIRKYLPRQLDLQKIYQAYQRQIRAKSVYDFDDMINFVVNKFTKDNQLLQSYQQQILYILVDEFQDSNNSQIELLDLLSSYFDKPNLFVVGDDDQSIFRFQGASVENIIKFNYHYSPQTIVLTNNYRSHQLILDSARQVISHNQSQLVKQIKDVDKNLISQVDYDPDPINLFSAQNPAHQATLIIQKIKQLLSQGIRPEDIAIIYRNHKDADPVEKLLSASQIKFTRRGQNILDLDYINYFIRLLRVVANPQDNMTVFSFLCLPFLAIPSSTLLKINYKIFHQKISLLDYLHSPKLKSKSIEKHLSHLADCVVQCQNLPLDRIFVYIANKFHYLSYLNRQANNFQSLSQFYNLFNYLKSYLQANPQAGLFDFITRLDLLNQHSLGLSQTLQSPTDQSISLMTVHSAKGLEFGHVFIINCLDGIWGNGRQKDNLPLPLGIVQTSLDLDKNEEDRRLFYVALTRAQKQIYIYYPQTKDSGKNATPSQFIFEIDPKNIDSNTDNQPLTSAHLLDLLTSTNSYFFTADNHSLIDHYLTTSYRFNITHLNSYLACPYCFFYKTIIKIPSVKSSKASLGTAIHTTLSYLYQNPKATLKKLTEILEFNLRQENLIEKDYTDMFGLGLDILKKYLIDHPHLTGVYQMEKNFTPYQLNFAGIPLTGKIDKIEILSSKTNGKSDIVVTDFKTGKYKPEKLAHKFDGSGGDYFRQILFYKLLIDLCPQLNLNFTFGQIEFVEPDIHNQQMVRNVDFTNQDLDSLKSLIKTTYQNILAQKFPINPACQNRDHLHQL